MQATAMLRCGLDLDGGTAGAGRGQPCGRGLPRDRGTQDPGGAVPGLLLKSGAEGVQGLALADGRAIAFKIDDGDGARRVRIAVAVALLRAIGADDLPGTDRAVLDELARPAVYGGGRVVGEVRVKLPF
jgi:L-asparaginase II